VLDDNDLQAGVEDGGDFGAAVKEDIEFQQGKAEVRFADAKGQRGDGRIVVCQGVTKGWLRVHCVHYLVLIGLYTTHLELFGDVLVNDITGCEDVSGHCEGKLALHEKLL